MLYPETSRHNGLMGSQSIWKWFDGEIPLGVGLGSIAGKIDQREAVQLLDDSRWGNSFPGKPAPEVPGLAQLESARENNNKLWKQGKWDAQAVDAGHEVDLAVYKAGLLPGSTFNTDTDISKREAYLALTKMEEEENDIIDAYKEDEDDSKAEEYYRKIDLARSRRRAAKHVKDAVWRNEKNPEFIKAPAVDVINPDPFWHNGEDPKVLQKQAKKHALLFDNPTRPFSSLIDAPFSHPGRSIDDILLDNQIKSLSNLFYFPKPAPPFEPLGGAGSYIYKGLRKKRKIREPEPAFLTPNKKLLQGRPGGEAATEVKKKGKRIREDEFAYLTKADALPGEEFKESTLAVYGLDLPRGKKKQPRLSLAEQIFLSADPDETWEEFSKDKEKED